MTTDPTTPPNLKAQVFTVVQHVADVVQAAAKDDHWSAVAGQGTVMFTRGWDDGTMDTMVISLDGLGWGRRDNPEGREVKRVRGTAEEVDKAMRELGVPGSPSAPDGADHTPSPTGEWT